MAVVGLELDNFVEARAVETVNPVDDGITLNAQTRARKRKEMVDDLKADLNRRR